MKYATVTEARSRLPQLVHSTERVALTRHGKPVAVLLDVQDYRNLALAETMVKDPQRLAAVHRDYVRFRQAAETAPPRTESGTVDQLIAEERELADWYQVGVHTAMVLSDEAQDKSLNQSIARLLAGLRDLEARFHDLETMAEHVRDMVEEDRRASQAG